MYCPHCGSYITSKTGFCQECGKRIDFNNKHKRSNFFHILLILIIIFSAALLFFLYRIDLYYNPDPCTIETDFFTKAILDKMDYGSDYQDTFLFIEDDYYSFFRVKDGRITGCSADETGQILEDGTRIIVKKTGRNYASLSYINSDYTATYVFRKATLMERFKFISLYF